MPAIDELRNAATTLRNTERDADRLHPIAQLLDDTVTLLDGLPDRTIDLLERRCRDITSHPLPDGWKATISYDGHNILNLTGEIRGLVERFEVVATPDGDWAVPDIDLTDFGSVIRYPTLAAVAASVIERFS